MSSSLYSDIADLQKGQHELKTSMAIMSEQLKQITGLVLDNAKIKMHAAYLEAATLLIDRSVHSYGPIGIILYSIK